MFYHLLSFQPGDVQDHDRNARRILSKLPRCLWKKLIISCSLLVINTFCWDVDRRFSLTMNQVNQLLSSLHSHLTLTTNEAQQLFKLNQTSTRGTTPARWVSVSSRSFSRLWTAGSRTSWCSIRIGVEPWSHTRWLRQSAPWVRVSAVWHDGCIMWW